jgi:hypothetical protein
MDTRLAQAWSKLQGFNDYDSIYYNNCLGAELLENAVKMGWKTEEGSPVLAELKRSLRLKPVAEEKVAHLPGLFRTELGLFKARLRTIFESLEGQPEPEENQALAAVEAGRLPPEWEFLELVQPRSLASFTSHLLRIHESLRDWSQNTRKPFILNLSRLLAPSLLPAHLQLEFLEQHGQPGHLSSSVSYFKSWHERMPDEQPQDIYVDGLWLSGAALSVGWEITIKHKQDSWHAGSMDKYSSEEHIYMEPFQLVLLRMVPAPMLPERCFHCPVYLTRLKSQLILHVDLKYED